MAQKLDGLRELNKALNQLEGKVASSISRSAISAAGKDVAEAARSRVPVETGNLKRSISVRTLRLGRTGYAAKVGPMKRKFRGRVEIGAGTFGSLTQIADGWYGHLVEFGTAPHLIPKRGSKVVKVNGKLVRGPVQHPGTPPRPFMRPAWQATKGQLVHKMGRVMWRRIEREARKAKK